MANETSPSAILNAWLPWYARFEVTPLFKPIGTALDAVLQGAIDAVRLRYPSVTLDERSLGFLGKDRRIPRAPDEPADSYARRLLLWLDQWSMAGTPAGLLYAVQPFIYPDYPRVQLVGRDSFWWTCNALTSRDLTIAEAVSLACPDVPGQDPVRYVPPIGAGTLPRAAIWGHQGSNWDWDSISNPERQTFWWDYWLVVSAPNYSFDGEYDGTGVDEVTYGENRAYGFDEPFGTFEVFRELIRLYQRAGAECRGVVFLDSANGCDPTATPDATWPDGRWGADSKDDGGVVVPTRNLDYRYLLPPF